MTRLPIPGKDSGTWGDILNDYLSTSHTSDGSLKDNVVGPAQLQDNSVGASQLQTNAVGASQLQDGAITESHLSGPISQDKITGLTDALTGKQDVSSLEADVASKLGTGGALDVKLLSTYVPLAALAKRARAATLSLITEMMSASRSLAVQVLGDSTGNEMTEWVGLIAGDLATRYPAHSVRVRTWNDTLQEYDRPTVVQTGTAGRQQATIAGASLRYWSAYGVAPVITGDLDIRVNLLMPDWSPGAVQTLVAQYGAAGSRAFRFQIGVDGKLRFEWSTDGTALQTFIQSSAAVPFADGTEGWVRVTLDVDNGAGGHTLTFYTSSDGGTTWTTLGTAVTRTTGTTSIYQSSAVPMEVGARTATIEVLAGSTIYEVEVHDGIGGQIIMPTLPMTWEPHASYTGTVSGAPALSVWNGSQPGASFTYLGDATRFPKLVPLAEQAITIVSCSHNQGTSSGAPYLSQIKAFVTQIRTRLPYTGIVALTQNPRIAPASYIEQHATRRWDIIRAAPALEVGVVDTYAAFVSDSRGLAALINAVDGIHPNADGSRVWATTVLAAIDATL